MEFKLEVDVDAKKVETIVVSYLKELHKRLLDVEIGFKRAYATGDIPANALLEYESTQELIKSVRSILEGMMEESEFRSFVSDGIHKSWAWEKEVKK